MMDFSSWVSEQRAAIDHLQVDSGYYEVRYSPRSRSYIAALASVTALPADPVVVDRLGGTVAITVRRGAAEYTFVPAWTQRGLSVERRSPVSVSRETADDTRGRALAALLLAAGRVYETHRDIALESGHTDEEREAVLRQLARAGQPQGSRPLDDALRPAVVAELQGREDEVELAEAQVACACLVCGRGYEKGDAGPIVVLGGTVLCRSCLPPARAA